MSKKRSQTDGGNGHGIGGRFCVGNTAGRNGSPYAAKVGKWRRELIKATTQKMVREIWGVLVAKAMEGERWAVVEFLDRTVGKSATYSDLELIGQVEELREVINEKFGKAHAAVGRQL